MKKILIYLLFVALMFSCIACSGETTEAPTGSNSVVDGGNSVVENTAAPTDGENNDLGSESRGERVTFGKLETEDIRNLCLATDKCFVYYEDSRFGGYGIADYDNVILAEANYSNFEKVNDKLVLWNTRQLVVYNTDGERLYKIQCSDEGRGFDANMDASDRYYYLVEIIEENEYENMDVYGTTLYTYEGEEVCSFTGSLRTYPNEQGFMLASTNRATTNAVIDISGNELQLTTDGQKIVSFSIHQEGDVYGGAYLFGTKYARFDSITVENGEEQYDISGIIDANTKTVTLLDESIRLYDCNNDYVIAVVTDENDNKTYGLYTDGFGELAINLSEHPVLSDYGLHDAKFFSREKGYILLTLTDGHYAVIDTNGEIIISATEGNIPFLTKSNYLSDNDCYPFETDDGYGIANLSGDIVIPCGQYRGMTEFIQGYAVANGETIINDKGEVILSIAQ